MTRQRQNEGEGDSIYRRFHGPTTKTRKPKKKPFEEQNHSTSILFTINIVDSINRKVGVSTSRFQYRKQVFETVANKTRAFRRPKRSPNDLVKLRDVKIIFCFKSATCYIRRRVAWKSHVGVPFKFRLEKYCKQNNQGRPSNEFNKKKTLA